MCGDAFGSFVKRRIKYERGKSFFPDTFLFVVFALVFVIPFVLKAVYEPINLVFFIGLTLILHPLFNIIANRARLKKVPW
jgi:CDP-diglyceride synthetase